MQLSYEALWTKMQFAMSHIKDAQENLHESDSPWM